MNFLFAILVLSGLWSMHVTLGSTEEQKIPVVKRETEPLKHSEGPYWDAEKQVLYFVDIAGHQVCQYDPSTTILTHVNIGVDVGFVIPFEDSKDKFIIGPANKLAVLTWNGTSANSTYLRILEEVETDLPGNRFNDAKADASGRVWAGTMGPEKPIGTTIPNRGALYSLSETSCRSKPVQYNVTISNGIAWSADNRTMFYIDSGPKLVYKFDYDISTGDASNRQVLIDFQKTGLSGTPDGMTIDDNDNLWIACWNGSKVLHVDSKTGNVLSEVKLPVERVTSATFGGPNHDILYVTTMREGLTDEELKKQPDAGAVFSVSNLNATGRNNNRRAANCLGCPPRQR
jgi:gluconolactonase